MKHGILAVDKPSGISSAGVVARVKRALKAGKAGHTGTLDPFATGLMLLGINRGTRISRFLLGGAKTYVAELRLGQVTDTLDPTGSLEYEAEPEMVSTLDHQSVLEAAKAFTGRISQVPPAYSALKHQGTPLYKLARKGQKVVKPPRDVEIYRLDVTEVRLPFVVIHVRCSSGTYIRSLARDIGESLGCGAHLSKLRRTESCGFDVDTSLNFDDLAGMEKKDIESRIIPMNEALQHMPGVDAAGSLHDTLRYGRPVAIEAVGLDPMELNDGFVKILDSKGELAAILEYNKSGHKYDYCCVFID